MKRVSNRWNAMQAELPLGVNWFPRRAVESLCRFTGDVFGKDGELEAEGMIKRCTLEAWLRFYTPLCERGCM